MNRACVALLCIVHVMVAVGNASTIPFSFDQLYPSSAVSHALNAVRYAYCLAQDIHDDLCDSDKVRTTWLDVYSAAQQLVAQQQSERVLCEAGVTIACLQDDLRQHIHATWQLTDKIYTQVHFKDSSLGNFVAHMRIACTQLFRKL